LNILGCDASLRGTKVPELIFAEFREADENTVRQMNIIVDLQREKRQSIHFIGKIHTTTFD